MLTTLLSHLAVTLLGPAPPRRRTGRERDAIRRHDHDSEILIGWVQLAGMLTFAALYAAHPSGGAPAVIPLTLGAYALFTALRLFLAYRHRLNAVFLALSIAADIAVLMITIASSLGPDGQPAAFIGSPTLYYVFIIIALRALRFDPTWVILTGGAAALGWLALWHVASGSWSFSASMALLGSEIDKLISVVMMTAVLGLAVTRARRLLIHAVEGGTAVSELSRFFSPDVVRSIIAADQAIRPGDGVERQAAVMFIDMRGFTRLAGGLDPKTLVTLLGEYQHAVGTIVRRHYGSIVTYLGDGIMITFGAAQPSPSYAADALAATEELIEVLGEWAAARRARGMPGPLIGIGVATGTVIYGAIGDEQRLEYATIGDPVNRAAKLQGHTKTENVRALVTEAAWSLAAAQGFEPARPYRQRLASAVRGIADPVDLVAID